MKLNRDKTRSLIKEKDIRFDWIAEKIGVHYKTICYLLNGRFKTISIKNAVAIAALLEVPVSEIVEEYLRAANSAPSLNEACSP